VIQLTILNGKKAGTEWVTRRFPFRAGRAAGCELCLDDEGVWDRHLEFNLKPAAGIFLAAQPSALTSVNGQPVAETLLRNGDLIEIGSLRLRFWLAPTRQGGLRLRESVTWLALALVSLGQVALIYWLLD
jgi:pSer/pThr/pTyr-binding forkhead associated (FHA) protein